VAETQEDPIVAATSGVVTALSAGSATEPVAGKLSPGAIIPAEGTGEGSVGDPAGSASRPVRSRRPAAKPVTGKPTTAKDAAVRHAGAKAAEIKAALQPPSKPAQTAGVPAQTAGTPASAAVTEAKSAAVRSSAARTEAAKSASAAKSEAARAAATQAATAKFAAAQAITRAVETAAALTRDSDRTVAESRAPFVPAEAEEASRAVTVGTPSRATSGVESGPIGHRVTQPGAGGATKRELAAAEADAGVPATGREVVTRDVSIPDLQVKASETAAPPPEESISASTKASPQRPPRAGRPKAAPRVMPMTGREATGREVPAAESLATVGYVSTGGSSAAATTAAPTGHATTAPVMLTVSNVVKRFGDTVAVAGVSLEVRAGSFFGIVGPNGAGKTTTLSMVTGLLRPNSGSIHVHGIDVWSRPNDAKRIIGVLPDRLRLFDRLTGSQLLYYSGMLRGLDSETVRHRSADLAAAFGLEDALNRLVADYSAGMTKKIALACAMIHSPRMLVLDEPFESVDPVSAVNVTEILQRYVASGGTVLLSSHGMDLIQRVCDNVAIIVQGKVLAAGTIDEVRGKKSLEEKFIELAGGRKVAEGMEWLHSFSD
jgi:ABC-2 type transport system ATP-binding protein